MASAQRLRQGLLEWLDKKEISYNLDFVGGKVELPIQGEGGPNELFNFSIEFIDAVRNSFTFQTKGFYDPYPVTAVFYAESPMVTFSDEVRDDLLREIDQLYRYLPGNFLKCFVYTPKHSDGKQLRFYADTHVYPDRVGPECYLSINWFELEVVSLLKMLRRSFKDDIQIADKDLQNLVDTLIEEEDKKEEES